MRGAPSGRTTITSASALSHRLTSAATHDSAMTRDSTEARTTDSVGRELTRLIRCTGGAALEYSIRVTPPKPVDSHGHPSSFRRRFCPLTRCGSRRRSQKAGTTTEDCYLPENQRTTASRSTPWMRAIVDLLRCLHITVDRGRALRQRSSCHFLERSMTGAVSRTGDIVVTVLHLLTHGADATLSVST